MRMRFRHREMVEVRPLAEIMATLDERATLDGLPFMPEMAEYCERRFQVQHTVKKLRMDRTQAWRIQSVVVLNGLCCKGQAHEDCKKGCHLFWHEAWLRPASATGDGPNGRPSSGPSEFPYPTKTGDNGRFCQFTGWLRGTRPLSKRDLGK